MMKYPRAFDRHDTERFEKFINLALEGKENIHLKHCILMIVKDFIRKRG